MAIANWISLSQSAGTSGTTVVTITADTYEELTARTTSIRVKTVNLNLYKDVQIIQHTEADYLTFDFISGGTLYWATSNSAFTKTIEYQVNNGSWNSVTTSGTTQIATVQAGDKIKVRGNNSTYGDNADSCGFYSPNAIFNIYGNIMSLIDSENYKILTSVPDYAFYSMFFANEGLRDASGLTLPATTLGAHCYEQMFAECTGMTSAPALPATTLSTACYEGMFGDCESLISAPALPATTLAEECYGGMFTHCYSLTQAPQLPATTLAASCYSNMFGSCYGLTTAPALPATNLAAGCYYTMFVDCTGMTQAPALPATNLATDCYNSMFLWCSNITTAPVLPATTLVDNCYYWMFRGCTKLNYIKCMATDISAEDCTFEWVKNVASAGTFVKEESMEDWLIDSNNGVPIGWTVQDAIDYSTEYLTFQIISGGTLYWYGGELLMASGTPKTIEYSKNNGSWSSITCSSGGSGTTITTVLAGDIVRFRGNFTSNKYSGDSWATDKKGHSCFKTNAKFNVYGNLASLRYGDNFITGRISPESYRLFADCKGLISAEYLVMGTGVNSYKYCGMFYGCSNMIKAPELTETTLAAGCYNYLFYGCSKVDYIKCMATNPATSYTEGWLYGAKSTGTFVKDANTTWQRSTDGIPTNWTVIDA